MPDLAANDFTVLCAVHDFFTKVLSRRLQHEVPLPNGLRVGGGMTADPETVKTLQRWLNVLDLAVTPSMFRDELETAGEKTAASLLKFYAANPEQVAVDRDKTDFVVTWLYRHSPESGEGAAPGMFERRIAGIVGQSSPLAEEYRQLLREFRFLREEADGALHFDQLTDSSIVQRVRDIKASFGASFYHPTVLATVAAYNVEFGKRFDELFKDATRQIKAFAEGVQQEGGNVFATVEDVTVKQLGEMEEQKILKTDYREAQEQFRKVSKIKKAVDSKRKRTTAPMMPPPTTSTTIRTMAEAKAAARSGAKTGQVAEDDRLAFIVPTESTMAFQIEQSNVLTLADTIRSFVKAADPGSAQVVPLKHGTITLAPHEVEAFRVDYVAEKSFRADFANMVMKIVSCCARIDAEMAGYKNTQASAYLWKPHADSLTNLVKNAHTLNVEANQLKATAMQRGLASKAENLGTSILKMQEKVKVATATLAQVGEK